MFWLHYKDLIAGQPFHVEAGVPAKLVVSPDQVSLAAGNAVSFQTEVYNQYGYPLFAEVVWQLEEEIGAVSQDGFFEARQVGAGRVIARSARPTRVIASVADVRGHAEAVIVPAELARLQVVPGEIALRAGERKPLVITGTDPYGNSTAVAADVHVSPAGLGRWVEDHQFEALGAGQGTITVTAGDLQQIIPVQISVGNVSRMDIRVPQEELLAARTYDFFAVGFDEGGNEIPIEAHWAVSSDVGTIDADTGRFYARTAGKGVVTARYENVNAFQWIEITAGELYSIFIRPNPLTLKSGDRHAFTLDGLDAEGNPLVVDQKAGHWDVVGRIGAFEDPGLFVATKMGKGKVTASIGDLLGQAYVTVDPGAPDPANARVRLTYPILPADGSATSEIRILIRDAHDNPVPGARVTLASDRQSDVLVQPAVTAGDGTTQGSIRSATPGRSVISAIVDGMVIPVRTEVLFE